MKAFYIGVVASLVFLAIYFNMDETALEDFDQITVSSANAYLRNPEKNDMIVIEQGELRYEIQNSLWRGRIETEPLLNTLKNTGEALLWYKPTDSRFIRATGLQTEDIRIDPAVGVDIANSNRRALLWLFLGFLGLGLAGGITALVTRLKERRT